MTPAEWLTLVQGAHRRKLRAYLGDPGALFRMADWPPSLLTQLGDQMGDLPEAIEAYLRAAPACLLRPPPTPEIYLPKADAELASMIGSVLCEHLAAFAWGRGEWTFRVAAMPQKILWSRVHVGYFIPVMVLDLPPERPAGDAATLGDEIGAAIYAGLANAAAWSTSPVDEINALPAIGDLRCRVLSGRCHGSPYGHDEDGCYKLRLTGVRVEVRARLDGAFFAGLDVERGFGLLLPSRGGSL